MDVRRLIDRGSLDAAGSATSLLCAIHCAVLPALVSLLPIWGLGFLVSEPAEWVVLIGAASLALVSLCFGFRQHRSRRALALLSVAVTLLLIGHLGTHGDLTGLPVSGQTLLVLGGLGLAAAHGVNYLLCRRCTACTCSADSSR